MSEHPDRTPSSPATALPLKLSSAVIAADRSRSRDLGLDRLWQLELSISARVLRAIDVTLATTGRSTECTIGPPDTIPAADRLELHINPILLSSLPGVIHLSGRNLGTRPDEAGAQSYTLTLTFSDGSATTRSWSTTFEVPRSPLIESRWRLAVPFSHSLTPAAP